MGDDCTKATLRAQAVLATLKESKANLLHGAKIGFYSDCAITDEEGKCTKEDLIWVAWDSPKMDVYIFPDGRSKMEATYIRKSRPALAVREAVNTSDQAHFLPIQVEAILSDTSEAKQEVIVPMLVTAVATNVPSSS